MTNLIKFQDDTTTTDLLRFQRCAEQVRQNSQAPFMGWFHLPEQSEALKQSAAWLAKIPKSQKNLVVLGIGGSCLGAKCVYDFLKPQHQVVFCDNIDGYSFQKILNGLNLKQTHFLAISKSGETSETLFQVGHVLSLLKKKKLRANQHLSVITENKVNTLRKISAELDLPSLPMPENVGGRFSVLTNVGVAPLLWAKVDVKKLLIGARWAQTQQEMVAEMTRFYARTFQDEKWISVFWFYVDGLRTFGLWLEQLWAESLAKAVNLKNQPAPRASTPLSCIGATDQHSLLQQFQEGARDKSFLFIRCQESERSLKIQSPGSLNLNLVKGRSLGELLGIEARATQKVLENSNHLTASLMVESHKPESIGALLFLFEWLVASLGEFLEINAFNQPGVEAVKKVTLGTLGDPRYTEHKLE